MSSTRDGEVPISNGITRYTNGYLNSPDDQTPAYESYYDWDPVTQTGSDAKLEKWYSTGKLNRGGDLPALIRYDTSGNVVLKEWYTFGKLNRSTGPAVIRTTIFIVNSVTYQFDSEEYYVNGSLVNSPTIDLSGGSGTENMPYAIKKYSGYTTIGGSLYPLYNFESKVNNQRQSVGGLPGVAEGVALDGTTILDIKARIWYESNKKSRGGDLPAISYGSGREEWYTNGILTRTGNPAVIIPPTRTGGTPTTKWYRDGKLHRSGNPAVEFETTETIELHVENLWPGVRSNGTVTNILKGVGDSVSVNDIVMEVTDQDLVIHSVRSDYNGTILSIIDLGSAVSPNSKLFTVGVSQQEVNLVREYWYNGIQGNFLETANLSLKTTALGAGKTTFVRGTETYIYSSTMSTRLVNVFIPDPPLDDPSKVLVVFVSLSEVVFMNSVYKTSLRTISSQLQSTETRTSSEYRLNGHYHRSDGPAVVGENGSEEYWVDGKKSRSDGPAVVGEDGSEEYWVGGKKSRSDGPAVVGTPKTLYNQSTKEFYEITPLEYWVDGKKNRTDGPAVVRDDGVVEYWVDGKKSRTGDLPAVIGIPIEIIHPKTKLPITVEPVEYWVDGKKSRTGDLPAVIERDGSEEYWVDGKRHRSGGNPAVIFLNGTRSYWVDGFRSRSGDLPALVGETPDGEVVREEWWKRITFIQNNNVFDRNVLGRDSDNPSVIDRLGSLRREYWINGGKSRAGGEPAVIETTLGPNPVTTLKEWWVSLYETFDLQGGGTVDIAVGSILQRDDNDLSLPVVERFDPVTGVLISYVLKQVNQTTGQFEFVFYNVTP